jgi:hypothetical protein
MSPDVESFFDRIIGIFFSTSDPEVEKKRLLKQIAKDLSKSRYKWYKPASEEALGGMGKFFYEIYKVISSAQIILANANASMVLKNVLIELSLTESQLKLKESFSEESLKERAKSVSPKELTLQVKDELSAFITEFDSEKIQTIDALYSQIEMLVNFVSFDYFFLLKKFDSNIPERTFSYTPKFEIIRGEYVLEDLKDFILIAYALPTDVDWPRIFSVIKAYRDVDPVAIGQWNKLLAVLSELRKSGYIEQIIRHISKDPSYRTKIEPISDKIVDNYIMKQRTQTEMVVQQIHQENRQGKAAGLLHQIFGTDAVVRLKNYAGRANAPFEKKMLGGFLYVEELNYMKAFLVDYFKRDIRSLTDLFLVRGKWSAPAMSAGYSGSFHELLEISDKITAFDENLAEDGELGAKLRGMLTRAERDKEIVKQLRTQLKDINEQALKFLSSGTQHLVVIARSLKNILDDYEKSPHELISNWKELEMNSDRPIKELIVEVYKQIYAFVSLMQLYLKAE